MPAVNDKLATPPILQKVVDALANEPDITPESAAALELGWNLSYYHGGRYMWVRGHGTDMDVLFVGTIDETATWAESLDQETILTMALAYIPTWKQTKSELGIRE